MATDLALSGGDMQGKLAYAKQLAGASMLPASYRNNPGAAQANIGQLNAALEYTTPGQSGPY